MISDFIKAKIKKPYTVKRTSAGWGHSAGAYTWRAQLGIKNPEPKKKSLFGVAKFEKAKSIKCEDCGKKVELYNAWASPCDHCGAEYNGFGQRLAPREQWGEETGEHFRDYEPGLDSVPDKLPKKIIKKSVPAGTRPFARRALPKEEVKQVRAKAPRYGMSKGVGAYMDDKADNKADDKGETKIKVKVKIKIKKSAYQQKCGACKGAGCKTCGGKGVSGNGSARGNQRVSKIGVGAYRSQGNYGAVDKSLTDPCDNCGLAPVSGGVPLCKGCAQSTEGTKGHASSVRATGNEPDKRGADRPSPEVPDQLPKAKVDKSFTPPAVSLGALSKTYVRVAASAAQGFLKKGEKGYSVKDGFGLDRAKTKGANTVEECGDCGFAGTGHHKCPMPNVKKSGYPQSQCKKCGFHGNALQVMTHMQTSHPIATRVLANESRQPSIRKSIEFKVLDENDPEYHGHTGGGAGYAGKKWVHMHGLTTNAGTLDDADFGTRGPKDEHRHFKMGAFTTHHSPSGYQEDIIGRTGQNEDDPLCKLPNCGDRQSQHTLDDSGYMACKDCNNRRPRRNVRHDFRA